MPASDDDAYRLAKALAHAAVHAPCGRVRRGPVAASAWPDRPGGWYLLRCRAGRPTLRSGDVAVPLRPGSQVLCPAAIGAWRGRGTIDSCLLHCDHRGAGDPLQRLSPPVVVHDSDDAWWPELFARTGALRAGDPWQRPQAVALVRLLLVDHLARAAAAQALRWRSSGMPGWLLRCIDRMEATLDDPDLSIAHLARVAGRSPSQLRRAFVAHLGLAPRAWLQAGRLARARQLLLDDRDASIAAVAVRCGFADPGYFARCFARVHGNSPTAWRQDGAAMRAGS